jgi:hypothetical protein
MNPWLVAWNGTHTQQDLVDLPQYIKEQLVAEGYDFLRDEQLTSPPEDSETCPDIANDCVEQTQATTDVNEHIRPDEYCWDVLDPHKELVFHLMGFEGRPRSFFNPRPTMLRTCSKYDGEDMVTHTQWPKLLPITDVSINVLSHHSFDEHC